MDSFNSRLEKAAVRIIVMEDRPEEIAQNAVQRQKGGKDERKMTLASTPRTQISEMQEYECLLQCYFYPITYK